MASIVDLCWSTAEELFDDLDLDELYLRQLRVLGAFADRTYPYLLVVYTGKITVAVNLGSCGGPVGLDGSFQWTSDGNSEALGVFSWTLAPESSE